MSKTYFTTKNKCPVYLFGYAVYNKQFILHMNANVTMYNTWFKSITIEITFKIFYYSISILKYLYTILVKLLPQKHINVCLFVYL